jgi:hypothetical protein
VKFQHVQAPSMSHRVRFGFAVSHQLDLEPVDSSLPSIRHYIEVGSKLRHDVESGLRFIDQSINDMVASMRESEPRLPCMFGYVYGSSGLGKTQLAFALKAKTLYVPMGRSVVTRTTVF